MISKGSILPLKLGLDLRIIREGPLDSGR